MYCICIIMYYVLCFVFTLVLAKDGFEITNHIKKWEQCLDICLNFLMISFQSYRQYSPSAVTNTLFQSFQIKVPPLN